MTTLRNKFLNNGIPFDEIDPEMIGLLDVLNFQLGLKTKFCCYGHDEHTKPYVIFDESVTDELIYSLAEQTGRAYLQINFHKWVRYHPVMTNWKLELGITFNTEKYKQIHMNNVVKCLRGCRTFVEQ